MTVFLCKIVNGNLDWGSEFNQARWHDFAKQHEGEYIRVEMPEKKRTRSQNNFYFLFLEIIGRETGNDVDTLHEFFKQKFLPKRFAIVKGKKFAHEVQIRQSTTNLSKIEFGEYLDRISALVEVSIPDPRLCEWYIPH